MNEKYKLQLADLLKYYGKRVKRPGKKYAIHVPHVGSTFPKTRLMLVGRALNGTFAPVSENYMSKNSGSIVDSRFQTASLDWLKDFRKSRFFDVTRNAMMSSYGLSEEEWFEHFTWSNLMKISPAIRGNPTDREYAIQLGHCLELFKMEIDILRPRNVLLLTDSDWSYEFLEYLKIDPEEAQVSRKYRFLRAKGIYKKSNILVFKRPEGENSEKFSKSICEHLV